MTEHNPKDLRSFLDETADFITEAKNIYGQAKPWPWTSDDLHNLLSDKSGNLRIERYATVTLALRLPDLLKRLERLHKIVDLECCTAEEVYESAEVEG